MIVARDFIWLHFPKCAGTSVEKALRQLRPDASFDPIDPKNVIWHETIPQRMRRDPSFRPAGKRVISCFRRLPHWLMSRVNFEASRPPHHVATREMILRGEFFEQSGKTNRADTYARMYDDPKVHAWIRTEAVAEDLSKALRLPLGDVSRVLPHDNASGVEGEVSDWFTRSELQRLYDANPVWASIERRVYGSTLRLPRSLFALRLFRKLTVDLGDKRRGHLVGDFPKRHAD